MATEHIFCTSCGTANRSDARSCYKCGKPIQAAPPSLSSAPAVPPAVSIQPPSIPSSPKSDFITLACPNCGGKLNITSDLERFACQFCGNEHIVRRSGGTVSLEPVMAMMNTLNESMSRVSAISEKQAAEMAIKRLDKEIEEIQKQSAQLEEGSSTSWAFFGISAVVLFMSIFVIIIAEGERIINVIFVPVGILSGFMTLIGFIVLLSVSSNKKKRRKEIDAAFTQKLAERARNKQIGDS